jgi:hypothetical protein
MVASMTPTILLFDSHPIGEDPFCRASVNEVLSKLP